MTNSNKQNCNLQCKNLKSLVIFFSDLVNFFANLVLVIFIEKPVAALVPYQCCHS